MQKLLLLAYAVAAERISANDVKDADTWDADREHVYKKLERASASCTRQQDRRSSSEEKSYRRWTISNN